MRIRPMTADDYDSCHDIYAAATMSSYGKVYGWLEAVVTDRASPLEPAEWTLVCEIHGAVSGYAAVSRQHLENLFVDPPMQGRGVGAALLAAVEARTGLPLTLRCLEVNPDARRFYQRHGFAVDRREEIHLLGRALPCWFMCKSAGKTAGDVP